MSHARVARLLQTMFLASAVVDVLIIDAVTMSSHYMLVIGLSLTYSGVVRLALSLSHDIRTHSRLSCLIAMPSLAGDDDLSVGTQVAGASDSWRDREGLLCGLLA